MTPKDFVALFWAEKDVFLRAYFAGNARTGVGQRIARLGLSPAQEEELEALVDEVLTDVFYTILLGLDGCAQLGGEQVAYRLADSEGHLLTGAGEIEALAWEAFHGNE